MSGRDPTLAPGHHPFIRPIIAEIPPTVPFVGPETLERARGRPFRARTGANENGFGPSARALAAISEHAHSIWKYADPTNHDLIEAIARHTGVRPQNIVVGEGIDGLLGLTLDLVADPAAVVVTSDGAYPTFNFHVARHGGRLVKRPYRDDREDLDALLDAARGLNARVMYVSNPDNPMGSWWPREQIERLPRALPAQCLLLLDEAYIDTLPLTDRPVIDADHAQVLRFRTFSKAYGLAGARIGYAIGPPDLIAGFEKVRNHYGINRLGQIAALAALEDQAHLATSVAAIERAKGRIAAIAVENGLLPLPSAAGFVAIDCRRDGAFADRVLSGLLARDVFARKPAVVPLNRCIRISAAPDADIDVFAAALPGAIADAIA